MTTSSTSGASILIHKTKHLASGFRLSLADLRGEFQERLLDWGLEYVRKLHATLDRASADVLVSLFQLLLVSSPRTQLRVKDSSRLLMLFSAMVVALLKLVKKGIGVRLSNV